MNNLVTFHLYITSLAEGSTARAVGAANFPSFTSGKWKGWISPSAQERQELKATSEREGWEAPVQDSDGPRTEEICFMSKGQCEVFAIKDFCSITFFPLFCRAYRSWKIRCINCLPYKPIHLQATDSKQSESKLLQSKQASKQTPSLLWNRWHKRTYLCAYYRNKCSPAWDHLTPLNRRIGAMWPWLKKTDRERERSRGEKPQHTHKREIPFIYRLLRVDILSSANWTKQLCKALLLVNKSLSRRRKRMYKSSVLVAGMFHYQLPPE